MCFRNEQLAALKTTAGPGSPADESKNGQFGVFFLTGRPLDFNRSAPQKISKTHFFLGHPVHWRLEVLLI